MMPLTGAPLGKPLEEIDVGWEIVPAEEPSAIPVPEHVPDLVEV